MLCNKQRGSDVVGAAPCAIVEKPHEGFWVLKDKPRSAGRKSVMRRRKQLFTLPPFQFLFEPPQPLFPGPVFHQRLSSVPTFLLLPSALSQTN